MTTTPPFPYQFPNNGRELERPTDDDNATGDTFPNNTWGDALADDAVRAEQHPVPNPDGRGRIPTPRTSTPTEDGRWHAAWRDARTGTIVRVLAETKDEADQLAQTGFDDWVRAGQPMPTPPPTPTATRTEGGRGTATPDALDYDAPRPLKRLANGRFLAYYRSLPSGSTSKRTFVDRAEGERWAIERWRKWVAAGRPSLRYTAPGDKPPLSKSKAAERKRRERAAKAVAEPTPEAEAPPAPAPPIVLPPLGAQLTVVLLSILDGHATPSMMLRGEGGQTWLVDVDSVTRTD